MIKSIYVLLLIITLAITINIAGCAKINIENTIDNQYIDSMESTITIPKDTIHYKVTIVPEEETQTTDETQPIYYGDWIIRKVQASGVGTYSEDDIKTLMNKTLSYLADKASYFGDNISYIGKVATNPIYTETSYTNSQFVDFHHIPTELLGLDTDVIIEINITDVNGHVSTLILKDIDSMLVFGGGTYFELTRSIVE